MAKIDRYNGNLKAFASEATGTERTIFGDTAQSDTLDANITMDLLRGWGVIGVASNPTKQHFNGLAFTLGQLIAYLHQRGVPEWNAAQEYYEGSVVTTLAGIYRLKSGGVGSSDPDTDGGVNWELIPTQAKVDAKADKATTYTETEVDGLLDAKADQATTYTKLETVAEFNQYGLGASARALDDANDMITPGTFGGPGAGGVNYPGNTRYGMLRVSGRSAHVRIQEALFGNDEFYIRYTNDSGVNWTDWEEVALLSEVNNLLNANVIGVGQTWQDVTGSRSDGVTYTNSTGKPIGISIDQVADGTVSLFIDGIRVAKMEGISGASLTLSSIVPVGAEYRVSGASVSSWFELR